jgi:hypothetical protein
MEQVWILFMLVLLFCPLMSDRFILIMFCIFLVLINNLSPFIGSILIIVHSLNYTHSFLDQESGHEEGALVRPI